MVAKGLETICFNYLTRTHASISNVFFKNLAFFDKNMCGYIKCLFKKNWGSLIEPPKLFYTISFKSFFDRPLDGYIVHFFLTYVFLCPAKNIKHHVKPNITKNGGTIYKKIKW